MTITTARRVYDMQALEAEEKEKFPVAGVVVPAYNEWENISSLVKEILFYVPAAQVVVVDDSPDRHTVEAVESLGLPSIKIIHRSSKGGRGSAAIAGIAALLEKGCRVIVEMDADFSHPPRQIPELVKVLEERQLDMLVASRYLPASRIANWPLSRRIFSKGANFLTKTLLQVPVSDYTNGFRAYSRAACEIITGHCGRLGTGFIPLSEILVQVYYRGLRVGEVPTHFVNRIRGESSVNVTEIKNAILGLCKIYGLKRRLLREKKR